MKTIVTVLAAAAATAAAPGSLILTGIFDGPLPGGDPKGVELYATAAITDLSIYGLETASNGGASGGAPEARFRLAAWPQGNSTTFPTATTETSPSGSDLRPIFRAPRGER